MHVLWTTSDMHVQSFHSYEGKPLLFLSPLDMLILACWSGLSRLSHVATVPYPQLEKRSKSGSTHGHKVRLPNDEYF